MASCTASRIVAYCARRSNKGTGLISSVICVVQNLWRSKSLFRNNRVKRLFFGPVEASENIRLNFRIAPTALRTNPTPVRVFSSKAMSVTAHPTSPNGGYAQHESVLGHFAPNNSTGAYERVSTQLGAAD